MNGFDYLDPAWLERKRGVKWSRPATGTLAAWVADMDFPVPDPVRHAMERVLEEGDLGYPNLDRGNPLAEPFAERMATRHGWTPQTDQVWAFTDVLNAVQAILEVTSAPGDGVAVHAPTYPPFPAALAVMRRPMLPIPFVNTLEGWRPDDEVAARAMSGARVLLLVNPHNPTGRVLTRAELEMLADLAAAHDLLVIADEVHAELVYEGHLHTPFATVSEDAAARTITITSASKTFNLAGIRTAVAHFGAANAWAALNERPEHLWGVVSNLSVTATLAAWREGDAWLEGLQSRLTANRTLVDCTISDELPEVHWHPPQGTYLGWLDFSRLGLGDDPAPFIQQRGAVELSPGPHFGPEGRGFARLNFATAPNILEEILNRIVRAVG